MLERSCNLRARTRHGTHTPRLPPAGPGSGAPPPRTALSAPRPAAGGWGSPALSAMRMSSPRPPAPGCCGGVKVDWGGGPGEAHPGFRRRKAGSQGGIPPGAGGSALPIAALCHLRSALPAAQRGPHRPGGPEVDVRCHFLKARRVNREGEGVGHLRISFELYSSWVFLCSFWYPNSDRKKGRLLHELRPRRFGKKK